MPLNPKEIMHADELNIWLKPYADLSGQSIDNVMSDITEIWKKEGQLLDSGELSLKLADKYLDEKNITPEAKQAIISDIADIEALKRQADHTTGVLKKDHKGVETALSHVYAQETGRPVMMLEFDFGNMGGTNELFQKKFAIESFQQQHGHASFTDAEAAFKSLASDEQKRLIDDINIKQTFEKTDMAAKIVTQTVVSDLHANFPDNKIIAIRTGGDELRFMVEGIDPSKYDDIIMATTHNVEIKMAELGLLDHEHAKGRDNVFKNGFGGGLAAEDMRNITDPDNIIAIMDEDVKAHKDSIGEVRANQHINITETVRRNMGIATETDITTLPPQQQRSFDLAVKQQQIYLEKNAENIRAHAPAPAQTIAEFDTRAAQILVRVDATPQLNANNPTLKSADIEGLTHSPYATIEEKRVAYMEQRRVPEYSVANGGQPIDGAVQNFMNAEAHSLNPMDPSANVNTVSDYHQNAQIWYDASTPDARPSTMFVGFQNLGGLNNLLGHDGADAVLKDMSVIVKTSLNEAGIESDKFVIAHNGGGEFRLVVQPGYEDQLKTAKLSIAEKTAALNSRDIGAYLADKGLELDDKTQQKIAGKNFTTVEDPKLRETHIGEQKIQGYVDGLAVITASSEMDIVIDDKNKAWDVDHILSAQKQSLDEATDSFRHQEILAYQGISSAHPAKPDINYTASRDAAATPPDTDDYLKQQWQEKESTEHHTSDVSKTNNATLTNDFENAQTNEDASSVSSQINDDNKAEKEEQDSNAPKKASNNAKNIKP
jgi:GGDEF domain-containing protein